MGYREEAIAIVPRVFIWFAVEWLTRACWWLKLGQRRSEPKLLHRCTALTVNILHSVPASLISLYVILGTGNGLDAAYDIAPCVPLPPPFLYPAVFVMRFSLSWAVWDAIGVFRDWEGEGAVMLLHAFVMGAALLLVLSITYMQHAMVCMLLFELSTPVLNIRKLLYMVKGKQATRSPSYQHITIIFGVTFLLARVIFGGPRILVHLYAIGLNLYSGRSSWQPQLESGCDSAVLALQNASLAVLQLALNFTWSAKIVSMALRQTRTGDGEKELVISGSSVPLGSGEVSASEKMPCGAAAITSTSKQQGRGENDQKSLH